MKLSPYWIQNDLPAPPEAPSYSDGTNSFPLRPSGNADGINMSFIRAILRGAASNIPCFTPIFLTADQRAVRLTIQQTALDTANKKYEELEEERAALQKKITSEPSADKRKQLRAEKSTVITKRDDQKKKIDRISNDVYKLQRDDLPYQDGNFKDPSNPVVIKFANFTYGVLLYLESSKGTPIPATEQAAIITELMDILDDQLRSIYYKGLTDTNIPLTWTPSGTTTPLPALDTMMRLSLFDMEFIGIDTQNKNGDVIAALKLRIGSDKAWNDTTGFPFRFFYRVKDDRRGWCLWVPNSMPDVYVEPNETDYYYSPAGTAGAYTRNDKGGASILPCYAMDSSGIIQPFPARGESVRSGAGGGAMRADRVTEADYKWSGNRALGYALNLDMKAYIPPTSGIFNFSHALDWLPAPDGYQKAQTPAKVGRSSDAVSKMNSEIIYFKKFNDPIPGKKNMPKATLPLPPGRFLKGGFHNVGDLVKKKKGSWEFGGSVFGKTGEVLKHMNADRESAGAVMRDAFTEMKFTVSGTDLGSATQFANWVAQNDPKAITYWSSASAEVKLFSDHSTDSLDTLKKQIRTSQEWCHLFGHGDGGSEELGNFISGSKHCNTEQLAIETGQRYQKYDGLTAKITAYLMPNQGFAKKEPTKADIAYLKYFDQTKVNLNDPADAEKAVRDYVEQYPNVDLTPYLASAPAATSGPVLSREAYVKLTPYQQWRVKKDVYEKFRSILTLHYPLGLFVRYKIYDGGKKIFDHGFSAQSESFDLNQFNILAHTVKRVIAASKGVQDEFVEAVNMKLKTRLQGEIDKTIKDLFASSGYEIR
ncbi:hypothetical protein [Paenibacillus kobensis]|uniref:hypothetical protein n=1 Tax=Paenibacillus kobensis TaxID=59841 RepID=UPI0015811EE4|nr:hypothetical protein [Paenibacillus kobensis]